MQLRNPVLLIPALLLAAFVSSCADSGMGDEGQTGRGLEQQQPVNFSTYMGRSTATRAVYPDGESGEILTLDQLKESGFGVTAVYTADKDYKSPDSYTGEPNFMFNQKVEWDKTKEAWTYSPVKYWPNGEGEANDETGTGATPHKVSFFAYAPYIKFFGRNDKDEEITQYPTYNSGIIKAPLNDVSTDGQRFEYRSNIIDLGEANYFDLLIADPIYDETKQKIGETVNFQFKHATAKLLLSVQGVFDELEPNNGEKAADTKIFINSVTLQLPVKQAADIRYCDRPVKWDNGSYSSSNGYTYKDENGNEINVNATEQWTECILTNSNWLPTSLSIDEAKTWTNSEADLADLKSLMDGDNTGVDATSRPLMKNDHFFLIVPNDDFHDKDYNAENGTGVIDYSRGTKIKIKYTVITRDPQLVRNTPKGYSIVTNTITATAKDFKDFHANHVYHINLLLGMTTVKFDVKDVDKWGEGDINEVVYLPENEAKEGGKDDGGGDITSINIMEESWPLEFPSGENWNLTSFTLDRETAMGYINNQMEDGAKFIAHIRLHDNAPDYTYWKIWLKASSWSDVYDNYYTKDNIELSKSETTAIEIPITAEMREKFKSAVENDKKDWEEGYKPTFLSLAGYYIWIDKFIFEPKTKD